MALKLDMTKAYDRIEWSFLEKIMLKLGFHNKWVQLVMMCVSLVSLSILLNGKKKGNFGATKGIQQRDPLSPYLFIICAEGFSHMISKVASSGCLKGIAVCRRAPPFPTCFSLMIVFCLQKRT